MTVLHVRSICTRMIASLSAESCQVRGVMLHMYVLQVACDYVSHTLATQARNIMVNDDMVIPCCSNILAERAGANPKPDARGCGDQVRQQDEAI